MSKPKPDNYFIEAWIKQNPRRLRTKRLRKKYYKNPFKYITGKLKRERFFRDFYAVCKEAYSEPIANLFPELHPLLEKIK
jgi:hypothetical protein